MSDAPNRAGGAPDREVVVITGGAGGMGLATAKLLGAEHHLVLTDVSQERLDEAVAELAGLGFTAEAVVADIASRESVERVAAAATAAGRVKAVVHTAGVSPQMGAPEFIVRINALGTVNVARAFLPIAGPGFSLVNVASMAGHMMPKPLLPRGAYRLAESDPERFVAKLVGRSKLGGKQAAGLAYGISKHFVMWFTEQIAEEFGAVNARVVSVSPGTFDTAMGRLEERSGSGAFLPIQALKRYGRPEEVAELLAFLADGHAFYLTATDILIDGGTVVGVAKHGRPRIG